MIVIDSNIWGYYFDESSKEHRAVAARLEQALSKEEVAVNTVILMEVAHFLVRNLGPVIARKKMETLLSWPMTISDFNFHQFEDSLDMLWNYSHSGLGGRDATILAAMRKLGAKKLMTHDADFKDVDWIEIVDPVGKA